MNKIVLIVFLSLNIACSHLSSGAPSSDGVAWNKLLIEPTEENYIAAKSRLSKEDKCDTRYGDLEYSDELYSLYDMISAGNSYAFELGLLIRECLDGGVLGDLHRSIGMFFDRRPSAFFQIVSGKLYSDRDLQSMLVMLPLDSVDDMPKQLSLHEKRLTVASRFENVIDPSLYEKVIVILTEAVENTKEIISDLSL